MLPADPTDRLDRHALVTAAWIAAGLVAATLFHYGLGAGGPTWVLAAFGVLLAGFGGHVIVNAVLGTEFTPREVALGLVVYGCAVLSVGLAVFMIDGFGQRHFLTFSAGLALLAAAVVFYMVIRYGVRQAFESFDVIREFKPRRASRLVRRRRRR
jgi:hypothetical protein